VKHVRRGARTQRLTRVGAAVAVGSAIGVLVGLLSGYRELFVIGVVGGCALLFALAVPRLLSPASFARVEQPHLVQRGSPATFAISVSAASATPPLRVVDRVGDTEVPLDVPALSAGSVSTHRYRVRPQRRGVQHVGPLREERLDPFGLALTTVGLGSETELLVHPVVHSLRLPEPSSRQRIQRAARMQVSHDPLADFRSLHEYAPGDDRRLVHWPSTARTGTLMVRDHFDLRRASRMVILDTLASTMPAALFEEAVEIAASVVCDSLDYGIGVIARTRDRAAPGAAVEVTSRRQALELFARVTQTAEADTVPAQQLRLAHAPADQIFVVAAVGSPLLRAVSTSRSVASRVVPIRIGLRQRNAAARTSITVASAEQFAARCRHGAVGFR
jgi:uncharacterized protein (DUF58 family)